MRNWVVRHHALLRHATLMQDANIGQGFALFYEAYATYLELKGSFERAALVYDEGLALCVGCGGNCCWQTAVASPWRLRGSMLSTTPQADLQRLGCPHCNAAPPLAFTPLTTHSAPALLVQVQGRHAHGTAQAQTRGVPAAHGEALLCASPGDVKPCALRRTCTGCVQ